MLEESKVKVLTAGKKSPVSVVLKKSFDFIGSTHIHFLPKRWITRSIPTYLYSNLNMKLKPAVG